MKSNGRRFGGLLLRVAVVGTPIRRDKRHRR